MMCPITETRVVSCLSDLEALAAGERSLSIRCAQDPGVGTGERSIDGESGLELPGLSVNPLSPERWWTRPTAEWLARQVCQ